MRRIGLPVAFVLFGAAAACSSSSPGGGHASGSAGAGSSGAAGGAGSSGAVGTAGATGSVGGAGSGGGAGSTGGAGSGGAAGSSGAAGSTGAAGSSGAAGSTGVAGSSGAAGSTGAAGTGVGGQSGSTGAAGKGAGGGSGTAGAGGAASCAQPTAGPQGTPTVGGLFTQPEPWTRDVSKLAPACRSAAILKALGTWGGGHLQIDFSIPLFVADPTTPRQTITSRPADGYCYGGTDCDAVPLQMPMPVGGNTEGSATYVCDTTGNTPGQGDCHVLVVETAQHKLYELYNATRAGTAFTALGAFIWDLTKAYPESLRGDQCTSADAGGFPIAALLPTADEVAAGSVPHALRFILPNASMKKLAYVHPGTHAGSPNSPDPNAPPYGVRFRLKPGFDETKFNAGERTILRAMKTYGMLLSDGGTIALTFADDRTTKAKWASAGGGITAASFAALKVADFDVVDLPAEIAVTNDCARNP